MTCGDAGFGCDLALPDDPGMNAWERQALVRRVAYSWGAFTKNIVIADDIDLVSVREAWLAVLAHTVFGNLEVALDRTSKDVDAPGTTFVDPTPLAWTRLEEAYPVQGILRLARLVPPLPACCRLRLRVDGGSGVGGFAAVLSVVLLVAPDDECECECEDEDDVIEHDDRYEAS